MRLATSGREQASETVRPSHKSVSLSAIWGDFWAAPWSFKFTCVYVFFEYVRPHQIYSWLAGPRWAFMFLGGALLAVLAEGPRRGARTIINWLLLAFTMVVLASSLTANYRSDSLDSLTLYAGWMLAFYLISHTAVTERRFFIFVVLFLLWSTKMSQHGFRTWAERGFTFAGYGVSGSPGWFANSGEFALQMTIFLPLSFYFLAALYPHLSKGKFALLAMLPITAIGSIAASSSRGGQLALAAIGVWMLARSKQRVRATLFLAVAAPLIWLVIPAKQKERFQTAGADKTSVLRLKYWKAGLDMANKHPVLGVGYNNWRSYYESNYFNPSDTLASVDPNGRPVIETSHNSFVEVGSQLGYLGLSVFSSLIIAIWVVNARSRKMLATIGERGRFLSYMAYGLDGGTIGFIFAGFFMAVAFYPFIWFQLAMTAALHTASRRLVALRPHAAAVSMPRASRPFGRSGRPPLPRGASNGAPVGRLA